MNCSGRCSGCALKIDAKAHGEVTNRTEAMLSALGGLPFFCHERMGWTPDKDGYPQGLPSIQNAIVNLMTAPSLIHNSPEVARVIEGCTETGVPQSFFDQERSVVGKAPVCEGWKIAVSDLHRQGWFRDRDKRKRWRALATAAFRALRKLYESKSEPERKRLIETIGDVLKQFAQAQREMGVRVDLDRA